MEVKCTTVDRGNLLSVPDSVGPAEQRLQSTGLAAGKSKFLRSSAETPVYDRDHITESAYPLCLYP